MNGRTILLIGSIVFIVLVLKAAATVPKAEQRKECENVQLSCPKSLEAAVGDDITLDFHLEPRCDATKWKGFVFECKQNSDIALVYKSGGFSDTDQAKQFRDKVSSDSSWDLSKGKLAWKIYQFGESDAGPYSCVVRTKHLQLPCSTELKIKQLDNPRKQNKAQYPTDLTVTLVLATLALLYLLHY